MVIDIFCHHIPRQIIEKVNLKRVEKAKDPNYKGPKRLSPPIENGDPEVRIGLMDKYGINIQALSLTTELLYGLTDDEAASICRIANNANYDLCKRYPDRFVNVCAIPLTDMKMAMYELERAINELDCRAVIVSTNQKGKGLDSKDYYPFYEKLVQYKLPLLLHPTYWESYPLVDESEWTLMSRFGWPFDTTQAVWRMIFGGVFDAFPTLKVIMHHLGAMFPYFVGRIETGLMKLSKRPPKDMEEYWKNIYGDTAVSAGPPEVYACGYAFFGPNRMLFGTDYPFGPDSGERHIKGNLSGVRSLKIAEEDMEKILGSNAKTLLKIE